MTISPALVRRSLGIARVGYGTALLLRPDTGQRLLGIDPKRNHTGAYLAQVFANRELFLGALGVGVAGPVAAKAGARWGVAVDTLDLIAVLLSARRGRHDTRTAVLLAAGSGAAVVAGRYSSR